MNNNGWSQVSRLVVCVAGDGRHEDVAEKRLGRLPKAIVKRMADDSVYISCEVETERIGILWQQLNDDISRNTTGEVSVYLI